MGRGVIFCPLPLLLIFSHSGSFTCFWKRRLAVQATQRSMNVYLPFSLFFNDILLYRCVLPIICVTVAVRYLCVTVYLFYLQVENYHEHVKMTKLKTASGKEKKSTREVGKESKSICFPCYLGPNVSLAPGTGKKRDTKNEAFLIRSNLLIHQRKVRQNVKVTKLEP